MTTQLLTLISGFVLLLLIFLVSWWLGSLSKRNKDQSLPHCCGPETKPLPKARDPEPDIADRSQKMNH